MDPAEEARRLFGSGDYVEVSQEMLKNKHNVSIFPCRLYQSVTGSKALILVCYRSRKGDDYGVSGQGLRLMESAKDDGRAKLCEIAFVSSNDPKNKTIDYVHGRITLEEQIEKLKGVTPMKGDWGDYFWVDIRGNPTRGGSAPDVPGDVFNGDWKSRPF